MEDVITIVLTSLATAGGAWLKGWADRRGGKWVPVTARLVQTVLREAALDAEEDVVKIKEKAGVGKLMSPNLRRDAESEALGRARRAFRDIGVKRVNLGDEDLRRELRLAHERNKRK